MKQYVICKDEAERAELLAKLDAMGWTWCDGEKIPEYKPISLSIRYESVDSGITPHWDDDCGKQTTIPRFLLSMEIQWLKKKLATFTTPMVKSILLDAIAERRAKRRALPKLGEEKPAPASPAIPRGVLEDMVRCEGLSCEECMAGPICPPAKCVERLARALLAAMPKGEAHPGCPECEDGIFSEEHNGWLFCFTCGRVERKPADLSGKKGEA